VGYGQPGGVVGLGGGRCGARPEAGRDSQAIHGLGARGELHGLSTGLGRVAERAPENPPGVGMRQPPFSRLKLREIALGSDRPRSGFPTRPQAAFREFFEEIGDFLALACVAGASRIAKEPLGRLITRARQRW